MQCWSRSVISIRLPGWLEHLLKPSVKRHSIHLWQRGEQYYLHQFSPGRVEFPVNGQLIIIFFSSCFNNPFSKWPPFRGTDETRYQAATYMLINPIIMYVKKNKQKKQVRAFMNNTLLQNTPSSQIHYKLLNMILKPCAKRHEHKLNANANSRKPPFPSFLIT